MKIIGNIAALSIFGTLHYFLLKHIMGDVGLKGVVFAAIFLLIQDLCQSLAIALYWKAWTVLYSLKKWFNGK